jgi:hypothetical protein
MEALTIVGGNITASCTGASRFADGSGIGTGSYKSTGATLTIVGGNITTRCTGNFYKERGNER